MSVRSGRFWALLLLCSSRRRHARYWRGWSSGVCSSDRPAPTAQASGGRPFAVREIARFDQPWAMTFLPGGSDALITEKAGRLIWWTGGRKVPVTGVPERSEERRVGKEGRARWSPSHLKK